MNTQEIKAIQNKIGVVADGFWGPKSITACQNYLRSLMPVPNPWPKSDQESLTGFYGRAGDESQLVTFDFPFPIFYEGHLTKKGRCHRKVKDSLLRVLKEIGDKWSSHPGIIEEAQDYGGIYANRPMRGASTPSLHARGAAIDLDDDDNGNHVSWPVKADMPIEIMEAFAREGWLSAGAFWGRDAMHFQATQ